MNIIITILTGALVLFAWFFGLAFLILLISVVGTVIYVPIKWAVALITNNGENNGKNN